MKLLLVSVILASCCLAFAAATNFANCGSKAEISSVTVSGCTVPGECILKRNTNVSIHIDFISQIQTNVVTTVVSGIIMDIPVPFPVPFPDACANGAIKCPVLEKNSYTYLTELQVLKTYPKVKVDVKWELQTADKTNLICIIVPVKIQ